MRRLTPFEQRLAIIIGTWVVMLGLNVALLPKRYGMVAELESVTLKPLPLIVRAVGNLEAKDSNTLKSQMDATVLSKQFREGQTVRAGQLLAVLSREKIRLDHQSRQNELHNAKADLARAKRDVKTQRELYRKEAVAYSAVEDAEHNLVKAQQALANSEESYRQAEIQWNSANVIAPINGTVVKDWIGDDKTVSSGKELVTVADVSEFSVRARVDELDIQKIHEGQWAKVSLQSFPDVILPGKVREIGSQSDGTGMLEVPVVIRLLQTNGLMLRPKLTAEARIECGLTEPVLSVPKTAIDNTSGQPKVWVAGFLKRIHSMPVTVGRDNPDRVEITSGLKPKQKVCVMAEPDYAEGMRVITGTASAQTKSVSKTQVLMSRLPRGNSKEEARAKAGGLASFFGGQKKAKTNP